MFVTCFLMKAYNRTTPPSPLPFTLTTAVVYPLPFINTPSPSTRFSTAISYSLSFKTAKKILKSSQYENRIHE